MTFPKYPSVRDMRRTDLTTEAEVVRAVVNGAYNGYRITLNANINYTKLKVLIPILLKKGFIKVMEGEKNIYVATAKGIKITQLYNELERLLK